MGAGDGTPTRRDEIIVFLVRRDTACSECGRELEHGSMIRIEEKNALCLSCADLDHLVFLPSGDAALTRRAGRHSTLRSVVVQWSRTRKRYERQGTLVEVTALAQAEEECLSDAEWRERRREREARARESQDRRYLESFAQAIREQYPGCPGGAEVEIAEHACEKRSGRVGRSAAARSLDPGAIALAVRAHVRHSHTDYDEHLMSGWERGAARAAVAAEVERVLDAWQTKGPAG